METTGSMEGFALHRRSTLSPNHLDEGRVKLPYASWRWGLSLGTSASRDENGRIEMAVRFFDGARRAWGGRSTVGNTVTGIPSVYPVSTLGQYAKPGVSNPFRQRRDIPVAWVTVSDAKGAIPAPLGSLLRPSQIPSILRPSRPYELCLKVGCLPLLPPVPSQPST